MRVTGRWVVPCLVLIGVWGGIYWMLPRGAAARRVVADLELPLRVGARGEFRGHDDGGPVGLRRLQLPPGDGSARLRATPVGGPSYHEARTLRFVREGGKQRVELAPDAWFTEGESWRFNVEQVAGWRPEERMRFYVHCESIPGHAYDEMFSTILWSRALIATLETGGLFLLWWLLRSLAGWLIGRRDPR